MKKYKVQKVNGVRIATRIEKDHNRPKVAPPVSTHKSKKDYDRRAMRQATRKASHGNVDAFCILTAAYDEQKKRSDKRSPLL